MNIKTTFFVNGISGQPNSDIGARVSIYDAAGIATLKRAMAEGHQLCSHTWSHQSLISRNDYNITYEMTRLNQAFKQIIGKIPTCVRPPFGDIGNNAAKILQAMGYAPDSNGGKAGIILWNMDPVDYNPSIHGTGAVNQINDMLNEYKLQLNPPANLGLPSIDSTFTGGVIGSPSTISLMHDIWSTTADFRPNGLIIPKQTVPLTQKAVEYLKTKGYQMVRIDECLGFPIDSMVCNF